MEAADVIMGVILTFFMYLGFKSGFVKKIISIICLGIALILAIKFSTDVAELIFEPIGATGRLGFILAFATILIVIMLSQSLLYRLLFKKHIESTWNHLGGVFIGLIEGGLTLSIALIVLSIYLHVPSEETRVNSMFYKPIKNFAPMVFDQINTFLPESEDFYQQMLKSTSGTGNSGGKEK